MGKRFSYERTQKLAELLERTDNCIEKRKQMLEKTMDILKKRGMSDADFADFCEKCTADYECLRDNPAYVKISLPEFMYDAAKKAD